MLLFVRYRRVSTTGQKEEGYSLPEQEYVTDQYAARLGGRVVADFCEDRSGFDIARPELAKALDMAETLREQGKEVAILVWNTDRLNRDAAYSMTIRRRLAQKGIGLHAADGGEVRGFLTEDIKAIVKEEQIREMKNNLANGKKSKARQGKIIGYGQAPYGYIKAGEDKRNYSLQIDEERAEVVRLIFRLYLYGHNGLPMPIRSISKYLIEQGIPAPHTRFEWKNFRGSGNWSREAVLKILRHPVYKGTFPHMRKSRAKGERAHMRAPEDWINVPCPAVVSEDDWELTQQRLNQGKEQSSRNTKHEYLLGRRITCSCGYKAAGRGTRDRYGKLRKIYYCNSKDRRYQGLPNCTIPAFRSEEVDALVWQHLTEQILVSSQLQKNLQALRDNTHTERDYLIRERALLQEAKDSTKEKLDKLLELYLEGSFDRDMLNEHRSKLESVLKTQQEGIEQVEERIAATGPTDEEINDFIFISQQLGADIWKDKQPPFEVKRKVIDFLDVRATMDVVQPEEAIKYLDEEIDWQLSGPQKVLYITTRLSPRRYATVMGLIYEASQKGDTDGKNHIERYDL